MSQKQQYYLFTDPMILGVKNGDVDDFACILGVIYAKIDVKIIFCDNGEDRFHKFVSCEDILIKSLWCYFEANDIEVMSEVVFHQIQVDKNRISMIHSPVQLHTLKLLEQSGMKTQKIFFQGNTMNDWNVRNTFGEKIPESAWIKDVLQNGHSSSSTNKSIKMANIFVGQMFREKTALKSLFINKTISQSIGIAGIQGFLNGFYVPYVNEATLKENTYCTASADNNYNWIVNNGENKAKDDYVRMFKIDKQTVIADNSKGNNFKNIWNELNTNQRESIFNNISELPCIVLECIDSNTSLCALGKQTLRWIFSAFQLMYGSEWLETCGFDTHKQFTSDKDVLLKINSGNIPFIQSPQHQDIEDVIMSVTPPLFDLVALIKVVEPHLVEPEKRLSDYINGGMELVLNFFSELSQKRSYNCSVSVAEENACKILNCRF
jgi:hypothetical protein